MRPLTCFLILTIFSLTSCSNKESSNESQGSSDVELGTLNHGFTIQKGVEDKFNEGLLLLHNFEYEDALSAFEEATALDSTEVLTHWGEAMCHYKALWRLQNTDLGKAIVNRLGDTKEERLSSINDPIEKDMWEMVEIMYGEGDFDSRNSKIKDHLSALHKKHPSHQEIAAFYALSLIWATEEYGSGSDDLKMAASIADDIIKTNPLHPGALHYKIHALDGPVSAKDALDAADGYAKVAPDAAHALHMPSHIYLALGKWDGVVNSNQRSYDASVNRMVEKELKDGARGYHSLSWLHYGLLQQGKHDKAGKILNDMLTYVPKDPTKGARGYVIGMQNRQLSASNNWDVKTPLDFDVKIDDIGIIAKAGRSFLRTQAAYKDNDLKTIEEEIDWLTKQIYTDSLNINGSGAAMCAAGNSRYGPTENSVKIAQVIKLQLEGLVALLQEDSALFENKMKLAVSLEDDTNFPTGPPKIANPSFEQYGYWLIEKGRFKEALNQFNTSLSRMPNRSEALCGKWMALQGLEDNGEAEKIKQALVSNYAHADEQIKRLLSE